MPASKPAFPNAMLGRHLGRRPATDEQRKKTLPLRPFLKLTGRPVPDTDDYATKAKAALREMMGNDGEGCCVATDLAKRVGMINAYRPGGGVLVATTQEVLTFYHQVGGPGDNGLYMPDAYNWWRDRGIKIGKALHKIDGYASFDITDVQTFNAACHWFGGVDLGVALTRQQYLHADDSDTWDIDGTDVVGGHAIPLTKRSADRCQVATWAKEPSITRRLLHSRGWCDEAYVVISREAIGPAGQDTNNVNWDALSAALAAVAAGGTPDIPPDPNPPQPPTPPVPGPGEVSLSGALDFFGNKLPIELKGTFSQLAAGVSQPGAPGSWIQIGLDVLAVLNAWRARDWVAFMAALEKLLADIGGVLNEREKAELRAALITFTETLPMIEGQKN